MTFPGLVEIDYARNIAKCETLKKKGEFNLQINQASYNVFKASTISDLKKVFTKELKRYTTDEEDNATTFYNVNMSIRSYSHYRAVSSLNAFPLSVKHR